MPRWVGGRIGQGLGRLQLIVRIVRIDGMIRLCHLSEIENMVSKSIIWVHVTVRLPVERKCLGQEGARDERFTTLNGVACGRDKRISSD